MDSEPVYEFEIDSEGMKLRLWRQEQLEREGVSEFTAFRLALNGVDLHQAIDLYRKARLRLGQEDAERWLVDQLLD